LNPTIPDLLWPAFRGRRAAMVAGLIFCLVVSAWCVVAAIDVYVNGYDGGIYVPESVCPQGPTYQACFKKAQRRELAKREDAAIQGRLTMATLPLVLAGLFGFLLWRVRNKDAPAVTRFVVQSPRDVVWVYGSQTSYRKHGREVARDSSVVVGTIRHQLFTLKMSQVEAARALAGLEALLPHASFGYSAEKQAQFQRDPAGLLRSGPAAGTPSPGYAVGASSVGIASGTWLPVAPHVGFGQIDQVMRSIGLAPESVGPLAAPGEPTGASWSASWARVGYRYDPTTQTRAVELNAQDTAGLHARIAATGLPIAGPPSGR
jgi:hypothetical protein